MTYTEQLIEDVERKEFAQIMVRSPVNSRYLEDGWKIVYEELPGGMATLRRPLPQCTCS